MPGRHALRRRWMSILALAGVAAVAAVLVVRLGSRARVTTGSDAAHGATILRYDLRSRFTGQTLPQVAVRPAGAAPGRPLLVFLHGRGGDGQESNANGSFLAALASLRDRAPDVVFPSGGDHSYWHARSSGDWARYVLDEVIPTAVRRLHADPGRVAIGGISMGGYGAYEIAAQRPATFCAVGGHSAAVWVSGGESAPGAFDDAEDFAHHDVVALARRAGRAAWGRAALWLDGGSDDTFHPGDTALAAALGIPMHVWRGGHEGAYWRRHYRTYLRFYAGALAACGRTA